MATIDQLRARFQAHVLDGDLIPSEENDIRKAMHNEPLQIVDQVVEHLHADADKFHGRFQDLVDSGVTSPTPARPDIAKAVTHYPTAKAKSIIDASTSFGAFDPTAAVAQLNKVMQRDPEGGSLVFIAMLQALNPDNHSDWTFYPCDDILASAVVSQPADVTGLSDAALSQALGALSRGGKETQAQILTRIASNDVARYPKTHARAIALACTDSLPAFDQDAAAKQVLALLHRDAHAGSQVLIALLDEDDDILPQSIDPNDDDLALAVVQQIDDVGLRQLSTSALHRLQHVLTSGNVSDAEEEACEKIRRFLEALA